jgi:hypothetical protein
MKDPIYAEMEHQWGTDFHTFSIMVVQIGELYEYWPVYNMHELNSCTCDDKKEYIDGQCKDRHCLANCAHCLRDKCEDEIEPKFVALATKAKETYAITNVIEIDAAIAQLEQENTAQAKRIANLQRIADLQKQKEFLDKEEKSLRDKLQL